MHGEAAVFIEKKDTKIAKKKKERRRICWRNRNNELIIGSIIRVII